jgi:hypothetical protein
MSICERWGLSRPPFTIAADTPGPVPGKQDLSHCLPPGFLEKSFRT